MKNSALVSKLIVSFAAATSILMFIWPLLISSPSANDAQVAQTTFLLLMPLVLLIAIVELTTKGIDSRQLAVLAVLVALNALVRMFGAGTAGIETAFFLIIIAAYVYGSQFGFILGAGSIFVSSLITAGVGPWLPFQMMAAALIGFAAGFLPKPKSTKYRITILVLYAILASFVYGTLMTIWNWPYLIGLQSEISYVAGAGFLENLRTFFAYDLFTGGLLWDLGRAITTSVLIMLTGPALLTTLNRAANRAGFSKD